jgi:hypothetical protein
MPGACTSSVNHALSNDTTSSSDRSALRNSGRTKRLTNSYTRMMPSTSSSSSVVPTAATQALPCNELALRPIGTALPGMRRCSLTINATSVRPMLASTSP